MKRSVADIIFHQFWQEVCFTEGFKCITNFLMVRSIFLRLKL